MDKDTTKYCSKAVPSDQVKRDSESWDLWECDPPSYSHDYDSDVVFHVLEGKALLVFSNGEEMPVSAGDLVNIKKGVSATWHIEKRIRNRYKYLG